MSKQVSIAQARDRLPALVHSAERGAEIQLTRRGKPVAVLISVGRYQRLGQDRPDFWAALADFRKTHDLAALRIDEVFRDVRDRSPGGAAEW